MNTRHRPAYLAHPTQPARPCRPAPTAARAAAWLATAVALSLLPGCGGGGGGSSDTATPTTPPVVVVKTTFTGTAATGAAMVGATVRVKCVAGSGTATATSSGAYTLELSDATLPCVVSATSSDGATVLHSLANPAGGTTQTININPLTELLVARVAAAAPASFYSGFGATAAARVTAATIDSAVSSVVATLRDGGVDFSAVGNPITAPLVAATSTTTGNAYDQALDALGAKLRTASTTLAQLATQVAAVAPNAPTASTAVGLPPALLLRTASPTCAALRSGTYRLINPGETDPNWASSLMQVDAATSTVTFRDGSTSSVTATGNCTFKNDTFKLRLVVSAAGVMVWTSYADNLGKQVMAISFPEQPATLADLAGTWNVLEFNNVQDQTPTPLWVNDFTVAVFGADGRHLSLSQCDGLAACAAKPGPFGAFRALTGGGFDYIEADGTSAMRAYIYRPASGDPMLVAVSGNSFLAVASLQKATAARALGETWGTWSLNMVPSGSAAATFSDVDYRASAVDTATQTYTRLAVADGNAQPFTANKPRTGLIYRPAGTSTLTNGQVVNFNELVVMPLPGTGLSAFGAITTNSNRSAGAFGFAVNKP